VSGAAGERLDDNSLLFVVRFNEVAVDRARFRREKWLGSIPAGDERAGAGSNEAVRTLVVFAQSVPGTA